jgi:Zn-dependent protease with chaperone function
MKNQKYLLFVINYLLLAAFFCGCATIYPSISPQEIREAQEELKVKALKFKIEQLVRINNVGWRLLKFLPEEDCRGKFVYTGLLLSEIDDYLKRLYNLSKDGGVVVIGIIRDSPAERAGILSGDIIDKIGDRKIRDIQDTSWILRRYKPEELVNLEIIRGESKLNLSLRLESKPLDVSFRMYDSQEVNAGVTSNLVVVTYGLMRFLKSDDELAVVLGHELAHITRGHLLKTTGTDLLSMILGIAAGVGVERISPGIGEMMASIVSSAFGARFTREFEKEADYFGLKYAYLAGYDIERGSDIWERFAIEVPSSLVEDFFSTHPTSAERLIRIKKAVSEIKEGKLP